MNKYNKSLFIQSFKRPCDGFTVSLFVVTPIIARLYAYLALGLHLEIGDLLFGIRGFASDILSGLLLSAAICMFLRKRSLIFILWGLWSIINSLDVAHIVVNESHMNAQFTALALKREFIIGSIFAIRNAIIIMTCAAMTLGFAFISGKVIKRRIQFGYMLAGAVVLSLACVVIPINISRQDWIQTSLVEANINTEFRSSVNLGGVLPKRLKDRFRYTDMSGELMIPRPTKYQNVILILLEGFSDKALHSGYMPFLEELSRENIYYTSFYSEQSQTNRGLMALVCGEYPNLFEYEAKADYYSTFGAPRPCLPKILTEKGYTTTYLQSAQLGYMSKGEFASAAGYNEILGEEYFKSPISVNGWGPDDLSFFRGALQKSIDLSSGASPWMLTLLTSGSHHPFNIPGKNDPSAAEIVTYMNSAVMEFIEGLRSKGILHNTLVLITADEASFFVTNPLERNHIPLIALVPEVKSSTTVDGFYTQLDVQTSILDYLNIPLHESIGRSIFRSYPMGREIVYGNTHQKRVYSYDSETDTMIICNSETAKCISVFDRELPQSYIQDLISFINYSDIGSDKKPYGIVFSLNDAKFSGTKEAKTIVGEKWVVLNEGETVELKLDMVSDGPVLVNVHFRGAENLLAQDADDILDKYASLERGKPLSIDLSYTSTEDNYLVTAFMFVDADTKTQYKIKNLTIRKIHSPR